MGFNSDHIETNTTHIRQKSNAQKSLQLILRKEIHLIVLGTITVLQYFIF